MEDTYGNNMSKVVVVVAVAAVATGARVHSAARVNPSVAETYGVVHGCYIKLQHGASRPRFFRVVIDNTQPADLTGDQVIWVDKWPVYEDEHDARGDSDVNMTRDSDALVGSRSFQALFDVVAPSRLQVAQYVSLHPTGAEQPRLSLVMARSLLKRVILHGASGVVWLQLEGVDYGQWRYTAYYKPSLANDASAWLETDAGIVSDDTMVSQSSMPSTHGRCGKLSCKLEPPGMGEHGRVVHDLLSLALSPHGPGSKHGNALRPHSVLLHGPSGSGKTTVVQLATELLKANLLTLDSTILATPHYRIEDMFTAALRIQPCVLLVEHIELIFPCAVDETRYKLLCRFLTCIDRIRSIDGSRVVVVGNVTNLRALNTKIRQAFEEEVPIKTPEKEWTVRLLDWLLPDKHMISEEAKFAIAVKYGQRPSNIVALVERMRESLTTSMDHAQVHSLLEKIGREVAASSQSAQTLSSSVPNVRWDDIGGLADVKQSLLEMVVWPLERPEVFVKMGISPPLGMLLHGPPGTGKTMLAKAAARASGCNFLNVSASDLMKAEFGESEKAVARVFDTARALSPCLVFIDEFQSLFGNRSTAGATTSRMISQLLVEMDSLKALAENRPGKTSGGSSHFGANRIFVLAATNAINAIDPAFLQPGRFENILYVGLPNVDERRAILELQMRRMPVHNDVDVQVLAEATQGANAASVVALCHAAAIKSMQRTTGSENKPSIEMRDFEDALGSFEFAHDDIDD